MTKVCIHPLCGDIALNCPKHETKCRNCGHRLVPINEETYEKKYKNLPVQVDYETDEIVSECVIISEFIDEVYEAQKAEAFDALEREAQSGHLPT